MGRVEMTEMERQLMERYTEAKPVVVGCDDDAHPDAHTVWLKVEQQSFCLTDYSETKEEADWMRLMLAKALSKVIANAQATRREG